MGVRLPWYVALLRYHVVFWSAQRSCVCRACRATHGLSTVADTGVLWAACRDTPVCHDVQGDIVTERQLCACVVLASSCRCTRRDVAELMCFSQHLPPVAHKSRQIQIVHVQCDRKNVVVATRSKCSTSAMGDTVPQYLLSKILQCLSSADKMYCEGSVAVDSSRLKDSSGHSHVGRGIGRIVLF